MLITTDLDATLLDETYSWRAAEPALRQTFERRVPLVLNSSKTLAEMLPLRRELIDAFAALDPEIGVVAENGGVVLDAEIAEPTVDDAVVVGAPRDRILSLAHALRREQNLAFEGFADWSVEQVQQHTGLDATSAQRAQQRLATEPILWHGDEQQLSLFTRELESHDLRILRGGRFLHLMGASDKVDGLERLVERRSANSGAGRGALPPIVALGDSPNDLAMLEAADIAVVVPHADGPHVRPEGGHVRVAPEPGPTGWNVEVLALLG